MWENAEFRNVTLGFERSGALNELSHMFCEQGTVLSSVSPRFEDVASSDYVKISEDGWL